MSGKPGGSYFDELLAAPARCTVCRSRRRSFLEVPGGSHFDELLAAPAKFEMRRFIVFFWNNAVRRRAMTSAKCLDVGSIPPTSPVPFLEPDDLLDVPGGSHFDELLAAPASSGNAFFWFPKATLKPPRAR